jgi:hypothetical protein
LELWPRIISPEIRRSFGEVRSILTKTLDLVNRSILSCWNANEKGESRRGGRLLNKAGLTLDEWWCDGGSEDGTKADGDAAA